MKLSSLFHKSAFQNFGQLHCFDIPVSSLDALLYGRTPHGAAYRGAVVHHAFSVFNQILPAIQEEPDNKSHIAIIDIPRGGIPCAEGVKMALSNHGIASSLISSRTKNDPSLLYAPDTDWDKYDAFILTDGVIGSGQTIINHLQQMPAQARAKTSVFCNVSSALGAANIGNALQHEMTMITGFLIPEENCQWMDFGNGKKVYFVGYNDKRDIDFKLPDFGDAIQPLTPSPQP